MRHAILDPRRWPLSLKAPVLVAGLMLLVSVAITDAVLSRLKETQRRHLAALSDTYLAGLASAVMPHVLRDDVWEVFDALDRSTTLAGGFGRARVVVVDAARRTIAAGDPAETPLGSDQSARDQRFVGNETLVVTEAEGHAHGRAILHHQDREIGRIYARYEIGPLLDERRAVLQTLVLSNAAIALLLSALAYQIIRSMLAPLARLSRHLDRAVEGPMAPMALDDAGTEGGEFWRLFQRFNALIAAVNEREALARQLATEERLASLGRLASGMAHEINNPLGGLFNAIDTLKRHGDREQVRSASLDLIDRGLRGIRDVVRSTLATYRADREQRALVPADLDDMRLLIQPTAADRGVVIDWRNQLSREVPLPATSVRQVLLNLVLNATAASGPGGTVGVCIMEVENRLVLEVCDQGPGLPPHAVAALVDCNLAPPMLGEGTGLGLWMTRRLVSELRGEIHLGQTPEGGAQIRVILPLQIATELRHVA